MTCSRLLAEAGHHAHEAMAAEHDWGDFMPAVGRAPRFLRASLDYSDDRSGGPLRYVDWPAAG